MKNKKCKREDCNKTFVTKDNRKMYCSRSCSAKVNNLGVKRHGSIYTNCIKCGNKLSRNYGKYCSLECSADYKSEIYKKLWLSGDKEVLQTIRRETIRKYLIEDSGNRCSVSNCSVNKFWCDKEITLIVDHIDGNAGNNLRSNVRLLCPNCNSQSPTFSGRNKGNGRKARGLSR